MIFLVIFVVLIVLLSIILRWDIIDKLKIDRNLAYVIFVFVLLCLLFFFIGNINNIIFFVAILYAYPEMLVVFILNITWLGMLSFIIFSKKANQKKIAVILLLVVSIAIGVMYYFEKNGEKIELNEEIINKKSLSKLRYWKGALRLSV